jgi:hypothetical protein
VPLSSVKSAVAAGIPVAGEYLPGQPTTSEQAALDLTGEWWVVTERDSFGATRRPVLEQGMRRQLAVRGLYAGFHQLVRRSLRGVWLRGELPPAPLIWAANHHSWWDGFLAAVVLGVKRRPAALLMDADNLAAFGFLRPLGVLPASQPRLALRALREGRVLVVFPEAELRPPGGLGELAPGAGWLARQAPAPLVPVAVRVVNRAHQYAEAYLDFGPAVEPDGLVDALGRQLRLLDEELAGIPPRDPPDGFRLLIDGRRSWDERIGEWHRRAAALRRGPRRSDQSAQPSEPVQSVQPVQSAQPGRFR